MLRRRAASATQTCHPTGWEAEPARRQKGDGRKCHAAAGGKPSPQDGKKEGCMAMPISKDPKEKSKKVSQAPKKCWTSRSGDPGKKVLRRRPVASRARTTAKKGAMRGNAD